MNETSGAILKIVSALTSPKSAIKFISIAIFLLLTGQAIEEFVVRSGSPLDYQQTIILFLGIGLGAIAGELVIRLVSILYSATIGRHKSKIEQEQKEKAIEERYKSLLEHFKITYKHMGKRSQRELWELSKGEVSICDEAESGSDIRFFVENGYAKHFSTVNGYCSIYQLHPCLKEYLQTTIPQHLELAFSKFKADQSRSMLSLLSLLEGKGDFESLGLDTTEYIKLCKEHCELLDYNCCWEYEEDGFSSHLAGYDIYIDPYHKEKLERLCGVSFGKVRVPSSQYT